MHSLVLRREIASLGAWCVCLIVAAPAVGQVAAQAHPPESSHRLLTVAEGRAIVNVAWQQDEPEPGMRDCSHVVHQIYANAGFDYPYVNSFDIYAGNENFVRVKSPHAGDLIAWPGHVGIVVDPVQHSFYSLVRSGLEEQDYHSPYWRSRGLPRFYRYKVERGRVISAANKESSSRGSNGHAQPTAGASAEMRTTAENADPNRPPVAASETRGVIFGPPAPPAAALSRDAEVASDIPASMLIATENKSPTREEVAESIAELSNARGRALRSGDPLKSELPVVIVEQFRVEQVDVKHDHSWARVAVDLRVLVSGGAAQVKLQHEKVRWELRRTESGWEVVAPADRTYVLHDAAVKNLAANLSQLTESDGAAEHQDAVLRQEAQLASLLNALLGNTQER
ncbi:MAG TPA: NlpC/P60 family protein [Candidatus Acidoferrum sp.]